MIMFVILYEKLLIIFHKVTSYKIACFGENWLDKGVFTFGLSFEEKICWFNIVVCF